MRTREKRFATLDIKPLSPQARQSHRAQWTKLQEQFVDAPGATVDEADQLVIWRVVAERGYPAGDFQQQLSNLSVVHGRTLHHYRKAARSAGVPHMTKPPPRICGRPWCTTASCSRAPRRHRQGLPATSRPCP
ncbi:hypothetical protein ACTMTI_56095 [Nonomuraea sp. H19]|uniref:hypothetical protein n=1 Tax=Nonomuraea sp. H19 TaxID=3452206 RepID=UPI003F8A8A55